MTVRGAGTVGGGSGAGRRIIGGRLSWGICEVEDRCPIWKSSCTGTLFWSLFSVLKTTTAHSVFITRQRWRGPPRRLTNIGFSSPRRGMERTTVLLRNNRSSPAWRPSTLSSTYSSRWSRFPPMAQHRRVGYVAQHRRVFRRRNQTRGRPPPSGLKFKLLHNQEDVQMCANPSADIPTNLRTDPRREIGAARGGRYSGGDHDYGENGQTGPRCPKRTIPLPEFV